MKLRPRLLLCLLVFSQVTHSQVFTQKSALVNSANAEIDKRGEVYFSFALPDKSQIPAFSQLISISHISGDSVFAYANGKEFSDFVESGVPFKVETTPSLLQAVSCINDPNQVRDWDSYPTYPAYEAILQQFATDHPDICRLVTIGELSSGRKLLALKITDNPDVVENEPEFLYTSSIHGDEVTGYILMLHLIDYLLTNYGKNDQVTQLVNNLEIYINPLANPDGTYRGGNNTVNGATRYNASNVDLNRNYPDPKAGAHPDGNAWQQETIAFMKFADNHHFTMSANFHGGSEVLNYPWDTWPRMPADYKWWYYVCRQYADTVHQYAKNYLNDYDKGVTNGYAWYTITGGRQDYMNYFKHCREVTIELSYTKLLPATSLLAHWNYNYRSMLNMMGQALYGLHGVVTDSVTGQPLSAKITLNSFDQDSSEVYTDAVAGDYHRLLKAGTYSVTVSSTGYKPKTFNVQVEDQKSYTDDVRLAKLSNPLGIAEKGVENEIHIWPNPLTGNILSITSQKIIENLDITDCNGKLVFHSTPRTEKLVINKHLPAGIYLLSIQTISGTAVRKIEVVR